MNKKANLKHGDNTIALNKKARFEFFIEEELEAGIALQGWEIKSLRDGRGQLTDSYVFIKNHEVWLIGSLITPLLSASTHIVADAQRTRKLLLHRKQISKFAGAVDRKGYSLVALALYWKNNHIKVKLALVKGKKEHDKRATLKERDWQRAKSRGFKEER